jgi:hypothetical protein
MTAKKFYLICQAEHRCMNDLPAKKKFLKKCEIFCLQGRDKLLQSNAQTDQPYNGQFYSFLLTLLITVQDLPMNSFLPCQQHSFCLQCRLIFAICVHICISIIFSPSLSHSLSLSLSLLHTHTQTHT